MSVQSRITRTARKAHVCYACREVIQAGARYEDISGVGDGGPFRDRVHLGCDWLLYAAWNVADLYPDEYPASVDEALECLGVGSPHYDAGWRDSFKAALKTSLVSWRALRPEERRRVKDHFREDRTRYNRDQDEDQAAEGVSL